MKNKVWILLILFFGSCTSEDYTATDMIVGGYGLNVVIIDSCEYLQAGLGYGQIFTHKGNCKHCKQQVR